MTDAEGTTKSGVKKGLLIGLVLAVAGAAGGFFLVHQLGLGGSQPMAAATSDASNDPADAPLPVFVALDPLIISLPRGDGMGHLRFAAQIEVEPAFASQVEAVKPRIVDVLNGYLRAVETEMLADPSALMRMRTQMLRRIQIVAGEGRVKDLLIMEFVLS